MDRPGDERFPAAGWTQPGQGPGNTTSLRADFPGRQIEAAWADAADILNLDSANPGMDWIVVSSSTADYARQVAQAALNVGVDYLDIQYSTAQITTLQSMAAEIAQAGRGFITEGGFHPGLPPAMVRFLALRFDWLERAIVGSVIREDWARLHIAQPAWEEFLRELMDFRAPTGVVVPGSAG